MMIQAGVLLLVLLLISWEMWQDLLVVQNGRFLTPAQQEALTWQIAAQYLALFLFLAFLVLTTTMPLATWVRWVLVGAVGLTAVYTAHNLLTHQLYLYRRRPPRRQLGEKRSLPQRQILQGIAAIRSGRWYLVALAIMLIFMFYQEYRFLTGI
ncbi:MAG: hypothetical protein KDE56_07430 [Anaerolineales bacterium]|nr:hypothetical protein [Anaerolineales bacterium]